MKLPVCRLHEKASLFAVKHRLGALPDQFREWSLGKINCIKNSLGHQFIKFFDRNNLLHFFP